MSVRINQRLNVELTIVDQDGDAVDLTAETGNVGLLVLDPDGTETTPTPAIVPPATDGKVSHQFVTGTLDKAGNWRVKAKLVTQGIPSSFLFFFVE